jgi:hypothetical protein
VCAVLRQRNGSLLPLSRNAGTSCGSSSCALTETVQPVRRSRMTYLGSMSRPATSATVSNSISGWKSVDIFFKEQHRIGNNSRRRAGPLYHQTTRCSNFGAILHRRGKMGEIPYDEIVEGNGLFVVFSARAVSGHCKNGNRELWPVETRTRHWRRSLAP